MRASFGIGVATCALFAVSQILLRGSQRIEHLASRRHAEDLAVVVAALEDYADEHACRYPARLAELIEQGAPRLRGWHLDESGTPCDAWGSAFVYVVPVPPGVRPIVHSVGPDRSAGTDDDLHVEGE